MSRTIKRKITVDAKEYIWTLQGNRIDGAAQSIKVHDGPHTKSLLYIDPYPWEFEVRPKVIAEAIRFALKHGWKPQETDGELAISMEAGTFLVLPEGVEFRHKR